MEYDLYDILTRSALKGLTVQLNDGRLSEGHDGPWYNQDTSLRTTAHWALIFSKAFELTKEKQYQDAAIRACNFLISKEGRPYNYAFFCRRSTSPKDKCNGLIGQAWVLEALILVGHQLSREKYLKVAKEVILLHPYDFINHSWSSIEIDGSTLGEHKTLNQQIWFTCMALIPGEILNEKYLLGVGSDFFYTSTKKFSSSRKA